MKKDININIIMFENLEKVAKRPHEKECIQNTLMYNPSIVNSRPHIMWVRYAYISKYAKTIR